MSKRKRFDETVSVRSQLNNMCSNGLGKKSLPGTEYRSSTLKFILHVIISILHVLIAHFTGEIGIGQQW